MGEGDTYLFLEKYIAFLGVAVQPCVTTTHTREMNTDKKHNLNRTMYLGRATVRAVRFDASVSRRLNNAGVCDGGRWYVTIKIHIRFYPPNNFLFLTPYFKLSST